MTFFMQILVKDIVKKPIAFERLKTTIETLQRHGIFVVSFFVFGLPGELPSERIRTRNFILENGIDWSFMNYATPLRGSELFNTARNSGWMEARHLEFGSIDMTDYVLNTPNISSDKIKREMFLLNLDVNFVNNASMARGDFTTAIRAFKEVIFRHYNQPFAHYFLSKCYSEIGAEDLSKLHRSTFHDIIELDKEWFDTAKLFSLDINLPQFEAQNQPSLTQL